MSQNVYEMNEWVKKTEKLYFFTSKKCFSLLKKAIKIIKLSC